ncbi:PAS domain S-box protein [Paraflavitalea soli]|uniref:histidine kinase n=1 Tax=Paraflavitalea soli TaxID=2315862 RepID=A0A3B7MQL5_9BACT|nr:PAS domain S-box protein [Paraflavitalea soli]AXY75609.1 PAS domain S-box protein [Paraflavitalea soli]
MNDEVSMSQIDTNALLEGDNFYKSLLSKLPIALYTCDKDGHILFFNEAAVELWGRKPEPGKELWCGSWEIYRTDGALMPLEECPMAIALKEGRAVHGQEIVIRRPDGSKRRVMPSPQLVFDAAGKLVGAVNMLSDITERRIVEEKMAHLAAIVDSSDDAIISKTLDGVITSWNEAAERIFGYKAAEAIGCSITMLIPPDRQDEEPKIVERLKRGERVDHFETKRITKNGKILDVSLTISPVKARDGRIIGASKILRDITQQRETERIIRDGEKLFKEQLERVVEERTAELVRTNEDLERSNHELEQYAYIASHDLQEPLRKIQTFAELLKTNAHDEAAVENYYDKINVSAKRMASLIKDVLNYSRLSKSDNVFGQVDLNQVLQDVKNDFELMIEQKKAIISISPLPVIRGDLQQLRQLFGNLLSNALKFSNHPPEIDVQFSLIELPPRKDSESHIPVQYAQITFKDKGIGFDQKYADQVFVVFKRLNNRQFYSGTGIGLALCKRIVERHGGTISASSELGKGTTFTIQLPVD